MKRANLGCGGINARGWVNIDRDFTETGYGEVVLKHDMREGLPFAENELDYAVANHVCSMFTPDELDRFLGECRRVIKPGGVLRIIDADMLHAMKAAETFSHRHFDPVEEWADDTLLARVTYFVTLGGARKSILTGAVMLDTLRRASFTGMRTVFGATVCEDREIMALDSREEESFVVEGIA